MAHRLRARARRRALAWVALVVVVTLLHALAARHLGSRLARWSDADTAMPQPLEVTFVHELAPEAPAAPPRVVKRRPARPPRAARVPADAASAAAPQPASAPAAAPPPEPTAMAAASAPAMHAPPVQAPQSPAAPDEHAAAADAAASGLAHAASPHAASASGPAFEWPPSTQLRYALHGYFRGDFYGSAQVEWATDGPRYQVSLDVDAGLLFARRMVSDGELTDDGLRPRRYAEETRVGWNEPRRLGMRFEPGQAVLAGGTRVPAPAHVQDTASQFVQLTWTFLTQPHRLRAGEAIEVPLALPRRVKRVVFDVVGEERLYTPVGAVDTFHLVPRPDPRPGGDLTAQVWVAPSLMYLPVRILINQDAETWIDLSLRKLPLQAGPAIRSPAPR